MNKGGKAMTLWGLLQAIGGAFFFSAIGGLTVIAVGSAASSGLPKSNPSGDFGYGLALLFMILACAGLGGILGFALIARLTSLGKVPGLTVTLAVLGYLGAGIGCFKFNQIMNQGRTGASQAIAQQNEHQTQINFEDQRLQEKASKDLPALMGPLMYPGAKFVRAYDPEYRRVTLTVTADIEAIDTYYKNLIFDRQREALSLKGKATRPGDGKALLIATEHFGRTSYNISFIMATIAGGPDKWPTDWRASMPPPNASSYPDPSVAPPKPVESLDVAAQWKPTDQSPEIAAAYGSLVYPGSKTNFESAHLPEGKERMSLVALSTTDSMDKVVAYYRSLVQVSVDNFDQFTGITKRQDGTRAFVSVRRDGEYTIITLSSG